MNFYHLAEMSQPQLTAQEHKEYIRGHGWDIRGRIYMSKQGVNAQFSGPVEEALAYTRWVAEQPAFEGLQWRSYDVSKNVFPKLRCKFRPNLISLQGGMESLPVVGAHLSRIGVVPLVLRRQLNSWSSARVMDMFTLKGRADVLCSNGISLTRAHVYVW